MRSAVFVAAMILLLSFIPLASAEIYRYTDSQGELHYVDDVAKVPKKYRKQLESSSRCRSFQ